MIYVGHWWNDANIPLVEISGAVYALYGWNGEKYTDCWKCLGEYLNQAGEETFCIEPVYKEAENGDFDIIGYELI